MYKELLVKHLNSKRAFTRRFCLKNLVKFQKKFSEDSPSTKNVAPLHYATNYYNSPYTPSACAYEAYRCGSSLIGVSDYASLNGVEELKNACAILKMPYSIGYFVDCMPLLKEKQSALYSYGISVKYAKEIDERLKFLRQEKLRRVYSVLEDINLEIKKYGLELSKKEVLKTSNYKKGGALTEKHIAIRLAEKICDKYSKNGGVENFITNKLLIELTDEERLFISSKNNNFYVTYLANVLYKKYCLKKKKPLLVNASQYITVNMAYGGISSYKIDIAKYDEEELIKALDFLKKYGFGGITFDCQSVSKERLNKICALALEKEMFVFDLYNLGLPGQTLKQSEENEMLFKFAMCMAGNSVATSYDVADGFFGKNTQKKCKKMLTRISIFENIGKEGYKNK
ncbi:MAG: hypothetical protein J6R29_01990 [Clostridia bacterium]|nr:hypothetical protein [Clostridia bacterium]